MDAAVSQCISHGPQEGAPRHHIDVLQDKNTLTRRALAVLKRNGFLVLSILLNVGDAPNIKVLPNEATRRLKDDSVGMEYGHGPDCKYWQAWIDGVRVVWTERNRS
jgi:hypothetical protein